MYRLKVTEKCLKMAASGSKYHPVNRARVFREINKIQIQIQKID